MDSDLDIDGDGSGDGALMWYTGSDWLRVGRIYAGTSVPGTCSEGDLFIDTDAASGAGFYFCKDGTYETPAGGGGGSSNLVNLTDTNISSPAEGELLIYDGSDSWDNKTVSGDMTISAEGVVVIAANAVALTTDTTGNYVGGVTTDQGLEWTPAEAGTVGLLSSCDDNYILKWDDVAGTWGCAADGGGQAGAAITLDLGDDGGNDSTDLAEIATTGDTNSIFTMPAGDKLLIAVANAWPEADALAAEPANCAVNNLAAGVTAAGVAEGCLDPILETELTNEAELQTQLGDINVIVETEITTFTLLNAITGNLLADNAVNTMTRGQIIDGAANEVQLIVEGSNPQTSDILLVRKYDATELFSVDNDGLATFGGTASTISGASGVDTTISPGTGQALILADKLEIPSGTAPGLDASGGLEWDSDDNCLEVYDGAASRLICTLITAQVTLIDPDSIQAITNDVPILAVEAEWAAGGITVVDAGIKTNASSTYSVDFNQRTAPNTSDTIIETVTTSVTLEAEDNAMSGTAAVPAGSIVFIDLPTTDVDWVQVWFTYYINEND
jgi:hypothetical protein